MAIFKQPLSAIDNRPIITQRRFLLTLVTLFILKFNAQQIYAFQYDIWFKYPHPHTQTDPINYCSESVALQTRQCQSGLPVYINTLDSPKTFIPYPMSQLVDFCPLKEAQEFEHSQHTEWDDNIRQAPFDIRFMRQEECKILCKKNYNFANLTDLYKLEELKLGVSRDYYYHFFADTLPFSWCYKSSQPQSSAGASSHNNPIHGLNSNIRGKECIIGFPIGYSTDDRGIPEDERVPVGNFTKPWTFYLYNHFDFTIFYESGDNKAWSGKLGGQTARITAVRINPRSINHESASVATNTATTNGQQAAPSTNKCSYAMRPLEIPSLNLYSQNISFQMSYSYSVKFVEDEPTASWSQRWQRLEVTLPGTAKGKWILMASVLLLIATALPAAYSVARTIFSDRVLISINPRDESDEAAWKVLAGDIFREPRFLALFSILVGAGCQWLSTIVISEISSYLIGLLSNTLIAIVVLLFVIIHGFVGGYVAVRLYKTFGGDMNTDVIATFVTLLNPLVLFFFLVMSRNLLLLYNASLMALNIGFFGGCFMIGFCFACSMPAAAIGGRVAARRPPIDFPVRPTANQRELSEQTLWKQPLYTTLAVGLIPWFCFWSVQNYPFYDSGGYVITVITVLIVICLSISHCYYHLTQYDYRWWWRSYLASGIAAAYYFLVCVYFIFNNLFVDTLSNALLYISFAFFLSVILFLIAGTIGFLVTFAFLWQTYSSTNASPNMNYAMFQKNAQIE